MTFTNPKTRRDLLPAMGSPRAVLPARGTNCQPSNDTSFRPTPPARVAGGFYLAQSRRSVAATVSRCGPFLRAAFVSPNLNFPGGESCRGFLSQNPIRHSAGSSRQTPDATSARAVSPMVAPPMAPAGPTQARGGQSCSR